MGFVVVAFCFVFLCFVVVVFARVVKSLQQGLVSVICFYFSQLRRVQVHEQVSSDGHIIDQQGVTGTGARDLGCGWSHQAVLLEHTELELRVGVARSPNSC